MSRHSDASFYIWGTVARFPWKPITVEKVTHFKPRSARWAVAKDAEQGWMHVIANRPH